MQEQLRTCVAHRGQKTGCRFGGAINKCQYQLGWIFVDCVLKWKSGRFEFDLGQ